MEEYLRIYTHYSGREQNAAHKSALWDVSFISDMAYTS
jgi:hypothetical protein